MSTWGIGIKWLLWSLVAALPVVAVNYFLDPPLAGRIPSWAFHGAAITLLAVGLPFWFVSAMTVKKNFQARILCTTGVFALCRNPIYAAWIFFLVPGILLFFRNPILLAVPFIMYAVLRVLLPKEEQWLEEQYGQDYAAYRQRTPRIFPWFPASSRAE